MQIWPRTLHHSPPKKFRHLLPIIVLSLSPSARAKANLRVSNDNAAGKVRTISSRRNLIFAPVPAYLEMSLGLAAFPRPGLRLIPRPGPRHAQNHPDDISCRDAGRPRAPLLRSE